MAAREESNLLLELPDLDTTQSWTLCALRQRCAELAERYERFLEEELGIRQVVEEPADLPGFALNLLLDTFFIKPKKGLHVTVRSDIPQGCGMGSSAAVVLSVLRAAGSYLNLKLDDDRIYEYALHGEKLQHGRPSGVDPYISLHGGFIRYRQNQVATELTVPTRPLCLAQTGMPESSTGECVMQVAKQHEESSIWDEFEDVALQVERALAGHDERALRELIRANHRLLVRIGVVPERIQAFIREVEKEGGAGKICGAGAVRGERAGVLLILADRRPEELAARYGYRLETIQAEPQGARLIESHEEQH